MKTIDDLKVEELKTIFETINYKSGLIVIALCLERMWQLALFAIKGRNLNEEIEIRRCIDIIWERIFCDDVALIKDLEKEYDDLLSYSQEKYEEGGDYPGDLYVQGCFDFCFNDYLSNALNSGWFFDENKTTRGAYVISCNLDLLRDFIGDNFAVKFPQYAYNNRSLGF